MPAVFYILGVIFAAISGYFGYQALNAVWMVSTALEIANFQAAHSGALTVALGAGIISALFFCTGAITEAILARKDNDDAL